MSSHPRECYIHANDFVFAQYIVNVYDNCANEFSILYECFSINAIVCWLVLLNFILMLMTIKFPLKMSELAFVCQLTLLNINTYSNILIESSINTNEMFSRVNDKRIYVNDITFGINERIFSGNEQQNVYLFGNFWRQCFHWPIHQPVLGRLVEFDVTRETQEGIGKE